MVTEIKKEEIRKEAKKLLDEFAGSLDRVKFKEKDLKESIGGFREEGLGIKCDILFRELMFENAPKSEGDCIIAEKKNW